MKKHKYLTTGKNRIEGLPGGPVEGAGVAIEVEKIDGDRLVRIGACYPQGHTMTSPVAMVQVPKFTPVDAVKKAVANGKLAKDGTPSIDYLEGLLDRPVSVEERDELFKSYAETAGK